jgi:hypothetical protein
MQSSDAVKPLCSETVRGAYGDKAGFCMTPKD